MSRIKFAFLPVFLFLAGFFPLAVCAQSLDSDSAATSHKMRPQRPSPNGTMNFNGRKMQKREGAFSIIGVKIDSAGDFLSVSVFFNDAVDSSSVNAQHILIDEKPLPPQTEFLFSKNRHMLRFNIKNTEGIFALKMAGGRSFDGKIMNPTEIKNLEANSFCKYSREARTWQKSSL